MDGSGTSQSIRYLDSSDVGGCVIAGPFRSDKAEVATKVPSLNKVTHGLICVGTCW